MEWAKEARPDIQWNLAMSGFSYLDPTLLPVDPAPVPLNGPNWHGVASVRTRVARRYGLPEDHVMPVAGTSLGIFLVFAASLDPGDHVLVEEPTYEALLRAAGTQGIVVNRFPRRFEEGWRVDPDRVMDALTPRTRIVALSDLHNPSGAAIDPGVRTKLKAMAAEKGFLLFVDEVYRDFIEGPVGTIYEPGAPVATASSLTKVYGLGGFRAGWILGSPELLKKAWQVQNLLHVNDPWPVVKYLEAAFDRADALRAMGLKVSAEGRAELARWVEERGDVGWVPPAGGLCSFPKLPEGLSGSAVSKVLREREKTLVVPGAFFENDAHIRVGVGAGAETVREGLTRLGRTLDHLKK